MEGGIAISVHLKPIAFAVSSVGLLHAAYSLDLHGTRSSSLRRSVCALRPADDRGHLQYISELERLRYNLEHPKEVL